MRNAQRPCLFTLGETAACLGICEDDLLVLLSDTVLAAENPTPPHFTCAEVETLECLLDYIHQFAAGSVYDGGNF